MIVTKELFYPILEFLKTQKIFFIDTETDGLEAYEGNRLCGIGLGLANGKVYYFPFRHKYEGSENLSLIQLKDLIEVINQASTVIGYNVKFDAHMMMQDGFIPWDMEIIDVLVAVRLTERDRFPRLSLSETIDKYYGPHSADYDRETKEILKSNKWKKDFSTAPIEILGPYCIEDVEWTRKLYLDKVRDIKILKQDKIWDIQKKLTRVLLRMEWHGIQIDHNYTLESLVKINLRKEVLEASIYENAGREFNILSSKQVGEAFTSLGISSPELTKSGNPSWNEAALFQIEHPLTPQIREYRTLGKLGNTYLEPFTESTSLHCSFCNWGTITGRLSSRNPNLQNIPRSIISVVGDDNELTDEMKERISNMVKARQGADTLIGGATVTAMTGFTTEKVLDEIDEDKISIRRMFIPRPGYKLVAFDYSQMEVRVFAYFCDNNEILKRMNEDNFDFHTEAAKVAFRVEDDNPDFHFYRQLAKAITFGVIYGIGNKKLAAQLGKTEEEAREYKDSYFNNVKGSREFINGTTKEIFDKGFVTNKFGRRYYLPKDKGYVGTNYLIQGTSADILSSRMIILDDYLDSVGAKMLVQIHDELICEIPEDNVYDISKVTRDILEENELGIPLVVDVSECEPSWAQKKDLKFV